MNLSSRITQLTNYYLEGYIDLPSVITEKARILLLANFGTIILFFFTSLNFFIHGTIGLIWANILVSITFLISTHLIRKVRYMAASTLSITGLMIFESTDLLEGLLAPTSDMIIYQMSDIVLTLILGFVFIGFVSFRNWQLYVYAAVSLILLTIYYLFIILTKNEELIPSEIHVILIDYLFAILAGSLGVVLNLNLTNRLMDIETERAKKLNEYNDNLELLVFDKTTDLNTRNQELNEKNKLLAEQQKRLINASKIKDSFLSNVSHELRTPLNAVVGLTNILINSHPKEEQKNHLHSLKHSSDSLLHLINDILDLSKIENDKFEFINIPFNIHQTLESLQNIYKTTAELKGLVFNCSISPNIPQEIIGDNGRLNQILSNLLSNAIKFTSQGKIDFLVTIAKENNKKVTLDFTIKDTGIGILQKDQELIFEKFTQLNENTIDGTGLGLSIVKKMVYSLEGDINLKSTVGKGSVFTLLLTYPISYRPITEKSIASTTNISKKKILLVEDNLMNQLVAEQILSSLNPTIVTATNGLKAFEVCQEMKFDLILMDIQMPIMDGLEATKRIKQEGLNKTTPIIALTANITDASKKEAFGVGMDEFIGKPFESEVLFQKMTTAMKAII